MVLLFEGTSASKLTHRDSSAKFAPRSPFPFRPKVVYLSFQRAFHLGMGWLSFS